MNLDLNLASLLHSSRPGFVSDGDAIGYFNHDLAFFLFFFFLMEMSINTGCAKKPLSPGAHLEIHLLVPLFAWLFQGNGGPCPTTPCPHVSFPHSSPWSCPASCMSWWAKATFPLFLKEVDPNWENHEAELKSLPGEREQTFITNRITPPLLLLSDRWSPEWKMGTVREGFLGDTER